METEITFDTPQHLLHVQCLNVDTCTAVKLKHAVRGHATIILHLDCQPQKVAPAIVASNICSDGRSTVTAAQGASCGARSHRSGVGCRPEGLPGTPSSSLMTCVQGLTTSPPVLSPLESNLTASTCPAGEVPLNAYISSNCSADAVPVIRVTQSLQRKHTTVSTKVYTPVL